MWHLARNGPLTWADHDLICDFRLTGWSPAGSAATTVVTDLFNPGAVICTQASCRPACGVRLISRLSRAPASPRRHTQHPTMYIPSERRTLDQTLRPHYGFLRPHLLRLNSNCPLEYALRIVPNANTQHNRIQIPFCPLVSRGSLHSQESA